MINVKEISVKEKNTTNPIVSVIVPLYNEEKYIEIFIKSLINQTYPMEQMEWIFVDGESEDNTVLIIDKYISSYPILLLKNTKKKTPFALNMAIKEAKGKYIIRMDAHAEFYPDYIEKCVYYLEHTDSANVGGVAETISRGFRGKVISFMLSTKFGVGGSDFRIGDADKYVDTVPYGAFKKEIFEKVGLFDTDLLRSEDNEMNARIRKAGGKIWLASDIRFKYYCRDTFSAILKMALQNGNALFYTMKKNPGATSLRHFIPFLFLLSVIVLPAISIICPLFKWIMYLELLVYLSLDLFFSFSSKKISYSAVLLWLYPLFHLTYGVGSLLGFFKVKLY